MVSKKPQKVVSKETHNPNAQRVVSKKPHVSIVAATTQDVSKKPQTPKVAAVKNTGTNSGGRKTNKVTHTQETQGKPAWGKGHGHKKK